MKGLDENRYLDRVSEYATKSENLPACKQDIESMVAIVEASDRFDEVLKFTGTVRASDVKTALSQKIDTLRGSQIEEVFFYYTGHGMFREDEFFFVLSDFAEHKLRQTSLQNSEIDNWFRTLNPELAVKVVDAPKFPNIPWFNCSIVMILSKSAIRFFFFFTEYVEKNWSDRELKLNFTWKTNEFPLAEEERISSFVLGRHQEFAGWAVEQIKKKFSRSEGPQTK